MMNGAYRVRFILYPGQLIAAPVQFQLIRLATAFKSAAFLHNGELVERISNETHSIWGMSVRAKPVIVHEGDRLESLDGVLLVIGQREMN